MYTYTDEELKKLAEDKDVQKRLAELIDGTAFFKEVRASGLFEKEEEKEEPEEGRSVK